MRKAIFLTLLFLSSIILLVRFGTDIFGNLLGLEEKSGIRVEANTAASVSLDSKAVGSTPLQKEDLKSGDHLIEVSSDKGSWRGYVKLTPGTLTVVNRELAPTSASSSGEIISLERGQGATITSNPSGSEVQIDGKVVGNTPLNVSSLSAGEHLFLISHANYLNRSIRAALTQGYALKLAVDLAISEADLSELPQISTPAPVATISVKQTPTGFLNVRESASLNSNIVERVSSGDTLTLENEQGFWDKVKLPDGKEGFVSTQYVQKKSP